MTRGDYSKKYNRITIGVFTISKLDSKRIFIEHIDGEGMECKMSELDAVIHKFFEKHF